MEMQKRSWVYNNFLRIVDEYDRIGILTVVRISQSVSELDQSDEFREP